MKTGLGVFVIGLMLIYIGLIDVDSDLVDTITILAGAFLAYVGVKLMKNRGRLVD
jgi:threonine/homoserine/homoserine lactone efflux protein